VRTWTQWIGLSRSGELDRSSAAGGGERAAGSFARTQGQPDQERFREEQSALAKGLAEHRLLVDGLGSGVEGRRNRLRRLRPEERDETSAHPNELAPAILAKTDDVDRGRRGDVMGPPQIQRLAEDVQELLDLAQV
jgi:hypothetical protein